MHRYSLKHSLNTLNDDFNIFNNFECTILQLSISRNKTVSGHAQCNRVLTHQQKKQKRWNVPSSPTFFNPTLVKIRRTYVLLIHRNFQQVYKQMILEDINLNTDL